MSEPIMLVLKPSPELSEAQLRVVQSVLEAQRRAVLAQLRMLDEISAEIRKLRAAPNVIPFDPNKVMPWEEQPEPEEASA